MNIVMLSLNYDCACASELLSRVINLNTEHKCRYLIGDITRFPSGGQFNETTDIIFKDKFDVDEIHQILKEADVLHFNQYNWNIKWSDLDWIRTRDSISQKKEDIPEIKWKDHLAGKVVIWHGHGGAWLLNPKSQMDSCREVGAIPITCSPIDEKVAPGIIWMPNPIPTSSDYLKPKERDWSGELIGGMASVAGDYKGKVPTEYVFEYVAKAGYPVRFEYITQMNRREALEKRKNWHITIDNWSQGFFGLAGLEGLALGHITIARLDSMAREKWDSLFKYDPIPIVDVKGMDECGKVLRDVCNDRELAKFIAMKSRRWIEENYTEKKTAEMWIDFYSNLPVAHGGRLNILKKQKISTEELNKTITVEPIISDMNDIEQFRQVKNLRKGERGTTTEKLPDLLDKKKLEEGYPLSKNNYIWKEFENTGSLKRPLDRIMGNASYNDFEIMKIKEMMTDRIQIIDKQRVADVGCGIGRNVPILQDVGFEEIVGIDYSPWMCEQFHGKYPNCPIYNLDIESLRSFHAKTFTVAFVMYVFIHIIDDQKLDKVIEALEWSTKDLIIIGQVMDPDHLISTEFCKVREVYDIYKRFKAFRMKHFFKDYYEIKADDDSWTNKISLLIMERR